MLLAQGPFRMKLWPVQPLSQERALLLKPRKLACSESGCGTCASLGSKPAKQQRDLRGSPQTQQLRNDLEHIDCRVRVKRLCAPHEHFLSQPLQAWRDGAKLRRRHEELVWMPLIWG